MVYLVCNLPINATDISKTSIYSNVMINLTKDGLAIVRDKIHFVEKVESMNIDRWRERFLIVVNEPCCDVRIVAWRWDSLRWKHHVDVQGCEYGKVLVGAVFGVDKKAPSLSSSNAYILRSNISWLDIHSINLNCSERMTVEINCVSGKITDIDDVDKISFAGLDGNRNILTVVDKATIRIRF